MKTVSLHHSLLLAGGLVLAQPALLHAHAEPDSAQTQANQATANLASDAEGGKLCAQGTRAIDQGRWAEAVDLFTRVAAMHGPHADVALYWKAYAENKLGQAKETQAACAHLRAEYAKSRWVDDCAALEVEIRARSGKRVVIDPNASDDVKLLALNTMLHQNEAQALAQIQEILKGDASEKLKTEAQFILGTHYSDVTYAQIVRIRAVEGDVRIQRGVPDSRQGNAPWEKAAADVPLQTGFSLVTGKGRAEIEFENASTIYLGENSVLTFNDLHETAGIPYTEMGLLSGTVSLYFQPYLAGEKLVLHTPTNDLISHYPDKSFARVRAFTDAVTITPLEGGNLRLPGVPKEALEPGRTWTYLQGQLVDAAGAPDSAAPNAPQSAAWDQWVNERVAQRNTAMQAMLQASGLSAPIPGLAEMAGQGKFFDCAPYGTCWEPNGEAAQDSANAEPGPQPGGRPDYEPSLHPHLELAAYHVGRSAAAFAAGTAGQAATAAPDADGGYAFPCTPDSILYRPYNGAAMSRVSSQLTQDRSYAWAVCHAGAWVRHNKRYAWVASGKRHHTAPVRWVRSGAVKGFVPLHPYDVKGQPAINARHDVFAVTGKSTLTIQAVRFDANQPITYLQDPPREYATAMLRPLVAVGDPQMEAHAYPQLHALGSDADRRPIRFDVQSQTFQVARQQTYGSLNVTGFAPMTNRTGSLQARAESFPGVSGVRVVSTGGVRGSGSGGSRAGSSGSGSSASGSHRSSSSASYSSSAASSSAASLSAAHH